MNLKRLSKTDSTRAINKESHFPETQCNALFAAILVHDDIDMAAELPEAIHLEYTEFQFTQCYQICLQLWQEGVERKLLARVAEQFYRRHCLDPELQLVFKNMRAKSKHLRFAYMAFDASHKVPHEFHRVIVKMGNLQDALKHDDFFEMRRTAVFLRLLTLRFVYAYSTRRISRFCPTTPAAFRDYVNGEIHYIRLNLSEEKITGRVFHDMRKVISRQVALYDNLKTLYPSPYHDSLSRYLSTLNGLMGNYHDELIAKHFDETQDYESYTFEVPANIRQLLKALTDKYEQPSK